MIDTVREPLEAAAYLQASFEAYEQDGNEEAFLLALRTIVDAQVGSPMIPCRQDDGDPGYLKEETSWHIAILR